MAKIKVERTPDGGAKITLPPTPAGCEKCGRPLDGSFMTSPYGVWGVPVYRDGVCMCNLCSEKADGGPYRSHLPNDSLAKLQAYEALVAEKGGGQ